MKRRFFYVDYFEQRAREIEKQNKALQFIKLDKIQDQFLTKGSLLPDEIIDSKGAIITPPDIEFFSSEMKLTETEMKPHVIVKQHASPTGFLDGKARKEYVVETDPEELKYFFPLEQIQNRSCSEFSHDKYPFPSTKRYYDINERKIEAKIGEMIKYKTHERKKQLSFDNVLTVGDDLTEIENIVFLTKSEDLLISTERKIKKDFLGIDEKTSRSRYKKLNHKHLDCPSIRSVLGKKRIEELSRKIEQDELALIDIPEEHQNRVKLSKTSTVQPDDIKSIKKSANRLRTQEVSVLFNDDPDIKLRDKVFNTLRYDKFKSPAKHVKNLGIEIGNVSKIFDEKKQQELFNKLTRYERNTLLSNEEENRNKTRKVKYGMEQIKLFDFGEEFTEEGILKGVERKLELQQFIDEVKPITAQQLTMSFIWETHLSVEENPLFEMRKMVIPVETNVNEQEKIQKVELREGREHFIGKYEPPKLKPKNEENELRSKNSTGKKENEKKKNEIFEEALKGDVGENKDDIAFLKKHSVDASNIDVNEYTYKDNKKKFLDFFNNSDDEGEEKKEPNKSNLLERKKVKVKKKVKRKKRKKKPKFKIIMDDFSSEEEMKEEDKKKPQFDFESMSENEKCIHKSITKSIAPSSGKNVFVFLESFSMYKLCVSSILINNLSEKFILICTTKRQVQILEDMLETHTDESIKSSFSRSLDDLSIGKGIILTDLETTKNYSGNVGRDVSLIYINRFTVNQNSLLKLLLRKPVENDDDDLEDMINTESGRLIVFTQVGGMTLKNIYRFCEKTVVLTGIGYEEPLKFTWSFPESNMNNSLDRQFLLDSFEKLNIDHENFSTPAVKVNSKIVEVFKNELVHGSYSSFVKVVNILQNKKLLNHFQDVIETTKRKTVHPKIKELCIRLKQLFATGDIENILVLTDYNETGIEFCGMNTKEEDPDYLAIVKVYKDTKMEQFFCLYDGTKFYELFEKDGNVTQKIILCDHKNLKKVYGTDRTPSFKFSQIVIYRDDEILKYSLSKLLPKSLFEQKVPVSYFIEGNKKYHEINAIVAEYLNNLTNTCKSMDEKMYPQDTTELIDQKTMKIISTITCRSKIIFYLSATAEVTLSEDDYALLNSLNMDYNFKLIERQLNIYEEDTNEEQKKVIDNLFVINGDTVVGIIRRNRISVVQKDQFITGGLDELVYLGLKFSKIHIIIQNDLTINIDQSDVIKMIGLCNNFSKFDVCWKFTFSFKETCRLINKIYELSDDRVGDDVKEIENGKELFLAATGVLNCWNITLMKEQSVKDVMNMDQEKLSDFGMCENRAGNFFQVCNKTLFGGKKEMKHHKKKQKLSNVAQKGLYKNPEIEKDYPKKKTKKFKKKKIEQTPMQTHQGQFNFVPAPGNMFVQPNLMRTPPPRSGGTFRPSQGNPEQMQMGMQYQQPVYYVAQPPTQMMMHQQGQFFQQPNQPVYQQPRMGYFGHPQPVQQGTGFISSLLSHLGSNKILRKKPDNVSQNFQTLTENSRIDKESGLQNPIDDTSPSKNMRSVLDKYKYKDKRKKK